MRNKLETRVLVSFLLTFCLLIAPITALAKKGEKNFKAGMKFEATQQWERAAQEFTLAVAADPSNLEYQLHFRRASFNASQAFMKQGRALAEQRDFVGAYNAFRQAYGYDPVNELAVSEMERMLRLQGVKEGTNGGNGTNGTNGNGAHNGTAANGTSVAQETLPPQRTEQLRVISYSGDLKAFIRSLAEQLNLNVVFDRQSFVQPRNTEINLRDVTTSQALDHIFLQEGLFFQKLSRRTILVADQTRRPQYQQLVLRTFYLSNSEPDKVKALVGQAIPPSVGRPQTIVVADKDTNSLTVRDTAENVRLIGELIESIDKDRAEVVMDVDIFEVSKTNFLQFGNQVGIPGPNGGPFSIGGSPGFSLLTDNGVISGGRGVNLAGIVGGVPTALAAALVIPPSALTAFNSRNKTKLIASTQVHAFNGEESTARIGQRVPVQTAQAYPFGIQTGQPAPGTNFPTGGFPVINYEPTGLTLKFTPQVFPNQDVQVKMSIESKEVIASGPTPTFTERTITGTARVQNNRTMMLASVATDVQSDGRQGLPILGLLPVIGRFFTSPTKDNRRVDIVIAVTPRVLRAPAITPRDEEMRPSGTLQSPTTGSLEALLRDADREDQLAAARVAKQNAVAQQVQPAMAQPVTPITTATTTTQTSPVASNTGAPVPAQVTTGIDTVAKNTTTTATPAEELPAFVPAPKSLVSSSAASEVAAVNNGLTNASQPVLTNTPKPIEASIPAVTPRSRITQIVMGPTSPMKAGEVRQFAVELKSHAPLALAVIALKFDPKVVKIRAVIAGPMVNGNKLAPSIIPSIDPNGVCLVSVSSRPGAPALQGAGTLLLIEVEAIASGDAGFTLNKEAMHVVSTDASDVALEVGPIPATLKQ